MNKKQFFGCSFIALVILWSLIVSSVVIHYKRNQPIEQDIKQYYQQPTDSIITSVHLIRDEIMIDLSKPDQPMTGEVKNSPQEPKNYSLELGTNETKNGRIRLISKGL